MSLTILRFITTSVQHHFTGTASSQARLNFSPTSKSQTQSRLLQRDDLHQEHQLYSCSCYYAAKDLSSVVYVHHHSLVVPSQYSDLTSGTTQLSPGSHTTTAADLFAVIFLHLYNLCPPCSIFFFMLICNPPTSPLNTLLL